jgi:hypothetical protein
MGKYEFLIIMGVMICFTFVALSLLSQKLPSSEISQGIQPSLGGEPGRPKDDRYGDWQARGDLEKAKEQLSQGSKDPNLPSLIEFLRDMLGLTPGYGDIGTGTTGGGGGGGTTTSTSSVTTTSTNSASSTTTTTKKGSGILIEWGDWFWPNVSKGTTQTTTRTATTSQTISVTTTTSRITTSSTTSRIAASFKTTTQTSIECKSCQIGSRCECVLKETCEKGLWIVKNLEGQPLEAPKFQDIPPMNVYFTPIATGKISILAICFEPAPVKVYKVTI